MEMEELVEVKALGSFAFTLGPHAPRESCTAYATLYARLANTLKYGSAVLQIAHPDVF